MVIRGQVMKYIILSILLTFSIVVSANTSLEEEVVNNTYLLQIMDDTLKDTDPIVAGTGSGFAITYNQIATNRHVALVGTYINVYTHKGIFVGKAEVVAKHKKYDIAVIQFIDPEIILKDHVELYSGEDPKYLTRLLGAGYPLGDGLIISMGRYQKYSKIMPQYMRATMSIAPGMSGGPVFIFNKETKRLEVIGIVTAFLYLEEDEHILRFPTMSLILSIEPIKALLDEE